MVVICVSQVVLDCPTDACFIYIYQYEPYLRDPVAYPKLQVRGGGREGPDFSQPLPEARASQAGEHVDFRCDRIQGLNMCPRSTPGFHSPLWEP